MYPDSPLAVRHECVHQAWLQHHAGQGVLCVARCCYHLAVTSLRASSTMASSRWRLLPRVVRVTVSQGTPPITSTCSQCSVFLVSRCSDTWCCSRTLSSRIQAPLHLMRWVPGLGSTTNLTSV